MSLELTLDSSRRHPNSPDNRMYTLDRHREPRRHNTRLRRHYSQARSPFGRASPCRCGFRQLVDDIRNVPCDAGL